MLRHSVWSFVAAFSRTTALRSTVDLSVASGGRYGPQRHTFVQASLLATQQVRDKILCVGKNYAEHAKELGDAIPDKPVLFLKPFSIAVEAQSNGDTLKVPLPKGPYSSHYEAEIVLQLGRDKTIQAVSLGLDLTLRDLQAKLKKQGHPWEISKAFRGAAIIGPWIPLAEFPNYLEEEFMFKLDGKIVQRGLGTDMTMGPKEALDYMEEHFPLCPGDVVFTGTPKGVGPLAPGQVGELIWGSKLEYKVAFA